MSDINNIKQDEGNEDVTLDGGDEDMSDTAVLAAKVQKIKDELATCQAERREYLEGWQRARADFINYKKEQDKLIGDLKRLTEAKMLSEILPIADGFEQAFSHTELIEQMSEALRTGFEQLHKELERLFTKYDITSFGAKGDEFDPALHSAVASEKTVDDTLDHTLALVHKRGYKQGAHVIRPALVAVFMKEP